ncbi:MAG: hypothetical protein Q4B91_00665 [Atopobiaceae bacterium]|nr:hypothetical protein [Atopobiaceae bacterium]
MSDDMPGWAARPAPESLGPRAPSTCRSISASCSRRGAGPRVATRRSGGAARLARAS